jgi:hypothetical protein
MKTRIALYCILGGVSLLIGALGTGGFFWWWLSGAVLAAAFVPVAVFGPRTALGLFGTIGWVLVIVSVLCTWSEALIFVPSPEMQQHPFRLLLGSCVLYLIVAGVLAVLARLLNLSSEQGPVPQYHGLAATAPRVLLSGLAYVFYYLVFGAITYQFFTKGYYPEATKVVEKLGLWFWAIQVGRGVLMTLAVLPVIYTLRMSRLQTAIVAGLVIWVAGGLSPLLIPNAFMGVAQRMIHIVEIFTQNFSLGVTAALLLRRSLGSDRDAVRADDVSS